MSAKHPSSTAVLPVRSATSANKTGAWEEIQGNVEDVVKDACARKTKAAAFQPTFTDISACSEVTRGIAQDYEKVRLIPFSQYDYLLIQLFRMPRNSQAAPRRYPGVGAEGSYSYPGKRR